MDVEGGWLRFDGLLHTRCSAMVSKHELRKNAGLVLGDCDVVCVCVCESVYVREREREREHLITHNGKHHNLSTCASLHTPNVDVYIYKQHNTCIIDMEIRC